MKKTLVALAALATVSSSFAQSSVTISGFLHGSYDMFSVKTAGAARTGNKSEDRVTDNSSRIVFNIVEDLGSGLSAVGQFDLRVGLDAQQRFAADDKPGATSLNPAGFAGTTGNNHVGLVSKALGGIRLGRQDIHYTEGAHFNHTATAIIASSINILHAAPGAANSSSANWSRTPNLLWYASPTIAGFSGVLGYSTNGTRTSGGYMEQENDMASNQRKGSTAYQRLAYTNGPLALVYSNVNSKSDWIGTGTISAGASVNSNAQSNPDQNSSIMTAKYTMGQFSVGYAAATNTRNAVALATLGAQTKVDTNQLGLGYKTGNHNFAYTLTNKGDTKSAGVTLANTGAKQTSLVYGYDLSKRTSINIAMVNLTNESGASMALFYNGENAIGSYGSSALAGEKHSATAISLKHSF
jgi:predicted porin